MELFIATVEVIGPILLVVAAMFTWGFQVGRVANSRIAYVLMFVFFVALWIASTIGTYNQLKPNSYYVEIGGIDHGELLRSTVVGFILANAACMIAGLGAALGYISASNEQEDETATSTDA